MSDTKWCAGLLVASGMHHLLACRSRCARARPRLLPLPRARFRGRIGFFADFEIPHWPADIDHARDPAANVTRKDIVEMRLDPRDFIFVRPNSIQIGAVRAREEIG